MIAILCGGILTSHVFALTPKEEKGVKVLQAPSLVYESPDWFTPFTLDKAPEELSYWLSILPYTGAHDEQMYLVIPTLGAITPVILIPETADDYRIMAGGGQIDINKYLVDGVLHYPATPLPGKVGNPVIFGHSNFYREGVGNYKTIFADLMNLDVGPYDEVWVYLRQEDGSYQRQRFAIEHSYETVPTDVEILLPTGGKEITIFACTNGLEGRRIVKGRYIEDNEVLIPYAMRQRLWELLQMLQEKSPARKEQIKLVVIEKIRDILTTLPAQTDDYEIKFKKYILNYLQREVNEIR